MASAGSELARLHEKAARWDEAADYYLLWARHEFGADLGIDDLRLWAMSTVVFETDNN